MSGSDSIRSKLRRVILITTGVVLVLTVLTFIINDIISFRRTYLERITVLVNVVADSSTATLAFRNPEEATRALATLHADPNILRAALYDQEGSLFAYYPTNTPAFFPASPPSAGRFFSSEVLRVVAPVVQERRVGTILVEADLAPIYRRLQFYSLVVAAVLGGCFFVALILSSYLQRSISGPVLSLAETARRITEQRDYTVRASKSSEDEIGALTDSFNDMLEQIAARDTALMQTAERLRLALEGSQAGTWDWNLRNNTIHWDEFSIRLLGLRPSQSTTTYEEFLQIIHPKDRAVVERVLKRALERKREFTLEARIIWGDGSMHYLSSRGKAFYDEVGKPVRMTGMTIDVSEMKRAEQALRESEERFRAMADAAPVLIWTSRENKQLDYCNKAWLEFTGRSLEQELGTGWIEMVHPEDLEKALQRYEAAFDQRERFSSEFRLRRNDGEYRWLLNHGVPRFAPDGSFQGYIGSCLDITDRKQAQVELERRVQLRTAELAETNRELEAFTYSVSHDLRSPLRHLNAYAQILLEDFSKSLPEEARGYLSRIQQGAKNMGNLVDDLLNLARVGRQELSMKRCELEPVVRSIIAEISADHPDRQIEWQLKPLAPAHCDPGLIKQVFTNLLSNAVKYTRKRQPAVIRIFETYQKEERVITIQDNGVGFNMNYASKLFGVFQRLHRPDEYEGTGVGLAIVERIIRKHGGRIWAEAELDKGAAFHFTLPVSASNELSAGIPEGENDTASN